MMCDASFFARYDALGAEAHQLASAKGNLDAAVAARDQCVTQLTQAKAAVTKCEAYTQEQRDRIELVSNHWFFGSTALQPQLWFRGGTEGKLDRAKAKLEKCVQEHPQLVSAAASIEQQALPPLQAAVQMHGDAHSRKMALDNERKTMHEQAIESNPSPTLHEIRSQAAAYAQQEQVGRGFTTQLHDIASRCDAARHKYEHAKKLMHEAQRLNEDAVKQHRNPPPPPQDTGEDHAAALRRRQAREKADQEKRDRKMHQAQRDADEAGQILRSAFSAVPGPVRERYPVQSSAFMSVQVPTLVQNDQMTKMLEAFGGAGGNLMAEWQAGQRIHQNLAVIQHCEAVSGQQKGLIQQVEAQVRAEADAAHQAHARALSASDAERERIFHELRSRATGSMPPPMAQPVPPMAVAAVPAAAPPAPIAFVAPQISPPPMGVPVSQSMGAPSVPMGSPVPQLPQMAPQAMPVMPPQPQQPPMAMSQMAQLSQMAQMAPQQTAAPHMGMSMPMAVSPGLPVAQSGGSPIIPPGMPMMSTQAMPMPPGMPMSTQAMPMPPGMAMSGQAIPMPPGMAVAPPPVAMTPPNALYYGSKIKLQHVATGARLHSHPHKYPNGSKQQQVTCYHGHDDNDWWRVLHAHPGGKGHDHGMVPDGGLVRLKHVGTKRNLHSHEVRAHVAKTQNEVSCYGEAGHGDANDNWRILYSQSADGAIRLQHANVGGMRGNHFLHSHAYNYPGWGFGQQEVTTFDGKDHNDLWHVEESK